MNKSNLVSVADLVPFIHVTHSSKFNQTIVVKVVLHTQVMAVPDT